LETRFDFFEIVWVRISDPKNPGARLSDQEGTILGKSRDNQGRWSYAVFMPTIKECWQFEEDELEPTGKMDIPENFYDGTHVTVIVDPITGEGRLKPKID
jgi:hypothetical protein